MWIDTCCIDKSSSREEQESINAMFRWYCDADMCVTYIHDIRKNDALKGECTYFYNSQTQKRSEWFDRGWTLQELLAPKNMQIYDADWEMMGTKTELAGPLAEITSIKAEYLTGVEDFRRACIAAKMSWMAGRHTTREEDMAYSMLGLFNVTMNLQYGEGNGAFLRLQELLIAKNDESLFVWKMPPEGPGDAFRVQSVCPFDLGPEEWGMLAPSAKCFAGRGKVNIDGKVVLRHRGGFTKTPQGISGPIHRKDHLMTSLFVNFTVVGAIPYHIWMFFRDRSTLKFSLNCWEPDEKGKMRAVQILLRPVQGDPRVWIRTFCSKYNLVRSVDSAGYSTIGTVWQP
ncbi:hypothetical protein B0I35DRAFT_440585 [Stachybotrys elegans]|uniref:Heterokaryon incompatibility domain-containing protein n=1 Tax=Stachybotrys elegans TaxID=80388 RepID=A0A8K0WN69_9HYPO|nr:hypothetical protein B0I35DRAFT_440585 [Stachybotrys elegans]